VDAHELNRNREAAASQPEDPTPEAETPQALDAAAPPPPEETGGGTPDPAPAGETPDGSTQPSAGDSAAPAIAAGPVGFEVGQRVWGSVLRLTDTQAVVSLSETGLEEGVLDLVHLRDEFGNLSVAEGDEVQAYVVELGSTLRLAPTLDPPAAEVYAKLEKLQADETPVRGRVTGINRGGLDVQIEGQRAFCPFSHIEIGRCEEPEIYLNRILDFMVNEVDATKKRIVVSRRVILERERREVLGDLRAQLKEGAEFDGVVKRLQPFGAFVDIGGLEGLVHVSEISYDRIDHPRDTLRVGEKVRVKVLGVSQDRQGRERIKLSIRALLEDPWERVAEQFHEGDIVTGKVMRMTDFGAFVKIYPGIEGLLHVSQYKPRQAPDTEAAEASDATPTEGQEVFVRIARIESERRRISLALREEDRPDEKMSAEAVVGEVVEGVVRNIKPYGVFVDLPSLGPWVSGLLPGAETGLAREENLARHFKKGDKAQVEIIEVDERGRIRLSQRSISEREAQANAREGKAAAAQTSPPGGFHPLADALKEVRDQLAPPAGGADAGDSHADRAPADPTPEAGEPNRDDRPAEPRGDGPGA